MVQTVIDFYSSQPCCKGRTPLEAAECAKAFKPKIAYPIHYRGSKPEDFADALKGTGIEVRVRKLEGED